MTTRQLFFGVLQTVLVLAVGCGSGSRSGTGGGGGTATTVTFNFKSPVPVAVAAKIGSGSFTPQTLIAGVLTLSIPNDTSGFAVAYVCPAETLTAGNSTYQQTLQVVLEASPADGTAFNRICPQVPGVAQTGPLAVNVDASGIQGASLLAIDALNGSSLTSGIFQGPIANSSLMAPSGNDRVEVFAFNQQIQGIAENLSLVAARNFANQSVPGSLSGGSAVVLGDADKVTSEAITYTGAPFGYTAPTTLVRFNMGNGGVVVVAENATSQYPALPAGAIETGDFYGFSSSAHNSSNIGESVFVGATAIVAGPMTIDFPVPWTYAGPTPAATPIFNFNYTGFSGKTGTLETASMVWAGSALQQNFYEVSASANYQSGSTTLALPDLSGLASFLPTPDSGTKIFWGALIQQNSWPLFQAMHNLDRRNQRRLFHSSVAFFDDGWSYGIAALERWIPAFLNFCWRTRG